MVAKPRVYSDSTGKELCRISELLFTKKRPWDRLCQELAENFYPMRADFTQALILGEDFALDLMDSYPVQANGQLADAIDAMLRQGEKWFSSSTGDADLDKKPAVAQALARVTAMINNGILRDPRAKVQSALKEADRDWVTFGCNVLSWEESQDRSHAVLKAHHPRDNAWMVNGDGQIDVNHRKLKMSAREIAKRVNSGRWKGPYHPDIDKALKNDPSTEFPLIHCLMPVDDIYGDDKGKKKLLGKNFVSIYYDEEHQMTLSEKPAPTFNYVISRWHTLGTWPWGFSPVAIQTLPDGRMSQALASMVLEQGEKALDPPMVGVGDVFRNDINLWAGGFTAVDLSDGRNLQDVMTVVDTAKNMPVGFEMKQDMRSMIAEGFLLNKLVLPNTKDMTAYEVGWRTDEFRRAALPFFTPIEMEYHAPLLNGALDIAVQLGMMDPRTLPPELHGAAAHWSFTSPLNEAEGQKVAAAFRQAAADVSTGMGIDPTIKDMFDWAEMAMDAVRGDGANPTWILDPDVVAARKAQNQQLNDAAAAASALQKGAGVAADVANATIAARNAGIIAPAQG
jgi:hypothetical protein